MKFSDSLISQLKNLTAQRMPDEDANGDFDEEFNPMDQGSESLIWVGR